MVNWILRTFPTPVLAAMLLVGLPVAASLGCVIFRRRAPEAVQSIENDVAGVIVSIIAGIYGIVVAFVIVVLWEDFRSAQDIQEALLVTPVAPHTPFSRSLVLHRDEEVRPWAWR